ncbi:hypothetical protein FIBSPDRAFT_1015486 [Athelia psychrophila]|uniref:Uncharacterized protein n=1 Tax=Athelia psychrophila TaxID=1759441 RepID=A0A167U783_9AGAM|nr:hypothetical protein FIBSPDRAFT_1015486 [Fibularhizoctonia sp. CBS 109695]
MWLASGLRMALWWRSAFCTTCRWPNPSARSRCPRTTGRSSSYLQTILKTPSSAKCALRKSTRRLTCRSSGASGSAYESYHSTRRAKLIRSWSRPTPRCTSRPNCATPPRPRLTSLKLRPPSETPRLGPRPLTRHLRRSRLPSAPPASASPRTATRTPAPSRSTSYAAFHALTSFTPSDTRPAFNGKLVGEGDYFQSDAAHSQRPARLISRYIRER